MSNLLYLFAIIAAVLLIISPLSAMAQILEFSPSATGPGVAATVLSSTLLINLVVANSTSWTGAIDLGSGSSSIQSLPQIITLASEQEQQIQTTTCIRI
ncbi:MAG: hypothetical protein M3P08_18800 [Thermoproteota archaeon]|jgi:hypothetical protein|nr:hypothetical protein [Thermoproteota archaeon]